MKSLVFVAALVLVGDLFGSGEPQFLGADGSGSGDLCAAANWDPEGVPDSSTAVQWPLSGTASASSPLTLGRLYSGGGSKTNAFDNCELTLGGLWNGYGGVSDVVDSNVLTFGPHAHIVAGDARFGYLKDAPGKGRNGSNLYVLESGAVVHFKSDMRIGHNYSHSNRLEVKAGAVLDLTRCFTGFGTYCVGSGSGCFNRIDLYGSCISTQNYEYVTMGEGAGAVSNVWRVHSGGVLQTKGNVYVGKGGSQNLLQVDAGGEICQNNSGTRYVYVGDESTAASNRLSIAEGATWSFACPLVVGNAGSWNRAEFMGATALPKATVGALAGGDFNVLSITGTTEITSVNLDNFSFGYGCDNEIRLAGLTLDGTANFKFGYFYDSSKKATVRGGRRNRMIVGPGTELTTSGNSIMDIGDGNELVFDRSSWTVLKPGSVARVYMNDSNTVSVVNGSTGTFLKDAFCLGGGTCGENELRVLSGSTATFGDLRFMASNNRLVISNATVVCVPASALIVPYSNGNPQDKVSTNNVIRFQGASPLFVCSNTLDVARLTKNDTLWHGETKLEFELPEAPYAEAPIQATSFSAKTGTRLRMILPDPRSAQATWYPLVAVTTGTIAIGDFADFASELPDGVRLVLSADRKTLSARVRGVGGACVIVR